MAVSYVSRGTYAAGNNAGLTPTLPGGALDTDLLVAVFAARGQGTIAFPSGWTVIYNAGATTSKIAIATRVKAGASAPAITYTGGSSGHTTQAVVLALRGDGGQTPEAVTLSTVSTGTSLNIGPVTGLTFADGELTLLFGHRTDDSGSSYIDGSGTFVGILEEPDTGGDDATLVVHAFNDALTAQTIPSITLTPVVAGVSRAWRALMVAFKAVNAPVLPSAGSLTLSGKVPSLVIPSAVAAGLGALVVTGYQPAFVSPGEVGAGSLTLTGYAPSLVLASRVEVGEGAGLALTGYAPTVQFSTGVTPGAGALTITGYAPLITRKISGRTFTGSLEAEGRGYSGSLVVTGRSYSQEA